MGTEARIVLYAPSESTAVEATRAAFARIEAIDALLSDYRTASEVSRLAAQPAHRASVVSEELATVLQSSLRFARETDGAFDVTIGPLTQLWRAARARDTIPTAAQVCSALASVGWKRVTFDSAQRRVSVGAPGMQFDFGGIAKGYAADEAMRVLRDRGVTRALLTFGGEIIAGDPAPNADGWPTAVANGERTVMLANAALSTSGDAEQFVEVNGVRYSHVIDARTGMALVTHAAATVKAPSAMIADALATSATLMDSASADRVVARYPGARMVARTGGMPTAIALNCQR